MSDRPTASRRRGAVGGLAVAVALALALVTGCSAPAEPDGSVVGQPSSLVDSSGSASSAETSPDAPALPPAGDADVVDTVVGAPAVSASTPIRIEIPAIGVDSDLIGLGLESDGTMEVPAAGFPRRLVRRLAHAGRAGPVDHHWACRLGRESRDLLPVTRTQQRGQCHRQP
ncbi:hypothetical protein O1W68_03500 [Rhodococcus sp. H36-A4]|uniref:hypothetical protein n=1 Tax=Rhodococcus sp. H36-A4 TaxID=3004353 RepID=UPI0022B07D57|nr:hypothetical protein [Rhodococcus sp. H36-A4]MCZ4076998.1 hypothetical protein [Rhodococcus sp. H36-A4]